MDKVLKIYTGVLVLCIMIACSPSRFVKPLAKGEKAVNASFGGPVIKQFGVAIPMPFATVGAGYGVDSTLTVHGAVNLTSVLFGNAQVEVGCTKRLMEQKGIRPALSITPQLNLISHFNPKAVINIYPQLDANMYWEYGTKSNLFYAGVFNWFELQGTRAHGIKQQKHWITAPQIGHLFNGKKIKFSLELKYIAPATRNDYIVVDYVSPLKNYGALGFYFGITKVF